MERSPHRLFWADAMRTVATLSVIILHTSAGMLYAIKDISLAHWSVACFYNSFSRFCVPLFLILTGSLLLGKEDSLFSFFKKRFSKILIPFLFWSLFYLLYHQAFQISWQDLRGLALRWSSYHLWYLYLLLGIYLFTPILNRWIKQAPYTEIIYFIGLWLLATTLEVWGNRLYFKTSIELRYFAGFIGYVVLGYFLIKYKNDKYIKFLYSIRYVIFIISFIITFAGTYYLSLRKESYQEVFHNNLSINVIMLSVAIFLIIINWKETNSNILNQFICQISKYSFGIYLIHPFVLYFLPNLGITYLLIHPILYVVLATTIVLSISFLISYLINKIPYLRRII
jgi:surface polysaccharide O-acyltransferase-like enzyme